MGEAIELQATRVRQIATALGVALLVATGVRSYRLIRSHIENPFFAPQILLVALSFWIATSVVRVGRGEGAVTLKEAIVLIRSGSLMLAIWGYRLYQSTHAATVSKSQERLGVNLAYMAIGTAVMILGLTVSRSIRGGRGRRK
jgi:hypothetical protein